MVTQVTDTRSNAPEQIANAARAIQQSQARRSVFTEVVRGKQKSKSVGEIAERTGLTRKQVLTAGKYLADHDVMEQSKKGTDTAYQKVPLLARNRLKILALAANPKKLMGFPTKSNPVITAVIRIAVPQRLVRTKQVTVDHFDSFRKAKGVAASQQPIPMLEDVFKQGFARILNEPGTSKTGGARKETYTQRV